MGAAFSPLPFLSLRQASHISTGDYIRIYSMKKYVLISGAALFFLGIVAYVIIAGAGIKPV